MRLRLAGLALLALALALALLAPGDAAAQCRNCGRNHQTGQRTSNVVRPSSSSGYRPISTDRQPAARTIPSTAKAHERVMRGYLLVTETGDRKRGRLGRVYRASRPGLADEAVKVFSSEAPWGHEEDGPIRGDHALAIQRAERLDSVIRRAGRVRSLGSITYRPEGLRGRRIEKGDGWFSHGPGSPTLSNEYVDAPDLLSFVDALMKQDLPERRRTIDEVKAALVATVRELRQHDLAHGRLDPERIRVMTNPDGTLWLRLISLGDVWHPELADMAPSGKPDLDSVHPGGRPYGRDMDNFPAALLYASLEAIAADPKAFKESSARTGLVFSVNDLKSPRAGGTAFARILDLDVDDPRAVRAVGATLALRNLLEGPPAAAPTLDDFVDLVDEATRRSTPKAPGAEVPAPVAATAPRAKPAPRPKTKSFRVLGPALAEDLVARGRFVSPELREGKVHEVRDFLELVPWKSDPSAFATVFRVKGKSGKDWAVRVFTAPGQAGTRGATAAHRRAAQRYQLLSKRIVAARKAGLRSLEPITFEQDGLELRKGVTYPIMTMPFIRGETLGDFVEDLVSRESPAEVRRQLDEVKAGLRAMMNELRQHDLAHGDLQHDNIMVVRARGKLALRLIDLDGAWTPELAKLKPLSVGQPDYAHPRRGGYYGREQDNFSAALIYTALDAISIDPRLYAQRRSGRSLLFTEHDLSDPDGPGSIFQQLGTTASSSGTARLGRESALLRAYLDRPARSVPPLEAFVAEATAAR